MGDKETPLRVGDSILDFVGHTPILRAQKLCPKGAAEVYIKLENFNPGGSIKTRVAHKMIINAEENGILTPNSNQVIIEPTGGNTGIGLAMVGAIRGYKVILVVPDNYSQHKIKICQAYGAKVILSDSKKGNNSHIELVNEIIKKHNKYIYLNQFTNPSNPYSHYESTGKEIITALGKIDSFVAGIGSGGTIMGVGRLIKEIFPEALVIGVQPEGCEVLKGKAIPHKIEGLAVGFLSSFLDTKIIDKVLSVSSSEAISYMRCLARSEGLFVGVSSAANICAAVRVAKELGEGKKVITIAPDTGRNYSHLYA